MTDKKNIILCIVIFLSIQMNAQFFRGIGIFIGGTMSSHLYENKHDLDSLNYAHTIPAPSHRSQEYFSYSAGILGEFLRYDRFRWQMEFEYCNKGAIERPLLIPWPVERGDKTVNKYTNIQWNNFAKFFLLEGNLGNPYVLLGARVEYNLSRSISAYPTVADKVRKITVTPDAALGFEFASYGKFKLFTELHYNPDLLRVKVDPVVFRSRTFELRLGIIFRPKKSSIDDCNAPRYYGNDY